VPSNKRRGNTGTEACLGVSVQALGTTTRDFAGPFKGKMFLVLLDSFSKWPEILEMSTTTTHRTITELRKLFAAHRLPQTFVTNNGRNGLPMNSDSSCT